MSDLAAEYSICPSKKEGGILGWVKLGQMVCSFLLSCPFYFGYESECEIGIWYLHCFLQIHSLYRTLAVT